MSDIQLTQEDILRLWNEAEKEISKLKEELRNAEQRIKIFSESQDRYDLLINERDKNLASLQLKSKEVSDAFWKERVRGDALEEKLKAAEDALAMIQRLAGHPSAAEGCRLIIKDVREALQKLKEMP